MCVAQLVEQWVVSLTVGSSNLLVQAKTKDMTELEQLEISLRRTGRTTRIVDTAVQTLFNTGFIRIEDHYWTGKNDDRHIFSVLLKRLYSEHGLQECIDNNLIKINHRKGTIQLCKTRKNLNV